MADRPRPFESESETSHFAKIQFATGLLAAAIRSSPVAGCVAYWPEKRVLAHSPAFAPYLAALADTHGPIHAAIGEIAAGQQQISIQISTAKLTLSGELKDGFLTLWMHDATEKEPASALDEIYPASENFSAILDQQGRFHRVSNALCQLLGYKAEEMTGEDFFSFLHPADREFAEREFGEYVAGQAKNSIDLRFRCADGAHKWLRWVAPPLNSTNSFIHATALDISQERQTQRKMQMLASIAQRTNNSVILTSPQGAIEWVNEGFERLTGYTLSEVQGKTPASILRILPSDEAVERKISSAASRGEGFTVQVFNRSKSGRAYWAEVEAQPIFDEHGRVENYMAIEVDITERKEWETRLLASERLLQDAGRMAQLGGWELDLTELRPIWSEEVCRIHEVPLGYRPTMEEAVEFYLSPYREQIAQLVKASIVSGKGWDTELEILTAKGNRKWVRAVGRPELEDGVCVRLLGSFQDITGRRHRDEQLRREEARNRALLLALPDYLLQLSSDGIVVDFHDSEMGSPSFPLLGSVGLPFEDFFPPEQWVDFQQALSRLEEQASVEVVEYDLWLDSKQHHFEARLSKTFLGDVLVLIRDLTNFKEAEQASQSYVQDLEDASFALERNAEQMREVLQQLADEKANAEAANQAKSQFLAVMSHEIRTPLNAVLGMSRLLVDSGLNADQQELAQTVMRSGEGLLEIINDILDFSKIEAGKVEIERIPFDLEQSMEDAIDMMSAKAKERGLHLLFWFDPEVPTKVVGDPGRLRQITLNFLSNAIKFTKEGYVLLSVRMMPDSQLTGEHKVRIEVEDTGPGIPADKLPLLFERFTQADSSTTRKFGGTGLGLAIVRELAELMGGRVEASSEVGTGSRFSIVVPLAALPEASQEVLTLPPYGNAVSITGSPQFERSLTRLLAEIEQHTVLLPGSGSKNAVCFTEEQFQSPMKGLDVARRIWGFQPVVPAPAIAPVYTSDFQGLRILLVEDNIVNQKVGLRLLEKIGCRVDLAANGLEAVEMARQLPYNLILMDCQMPEMDGFEAAQTIRQLPGDAGQVPIVALTAAATQEDRDRCLAAGMNDYLSKPISLEHLGGAIAKWKHPSPERWEVLSAT